MLIKDYGGMCQEVYISRLKHRLVSNGAYQRRKKIPTSFRTPRLHVERFLSSLLNELSPIAEQYFE